ncbi:hypothetical protein AVEN_259671-1 [Araneus ventricosus]|uniref:Uncharacterized protein n=1 Tax=Araneus ventricosus TaxID=182803 RepID=A0A4Y2Q370_ARAVE|nr:hypothetical protein AVEN_259671-1 [Araneus ventricosus]
MDPVILNGDRMTRTIPEVTLPLHTSSPDQRIVCPTTSDFTFTRPTYTTDLWWNCLNGKRRPYTQQISKLKYSPRMRTLSNQLPPQGAPKVLDRVALWGSSWPVHSHQIPHLWIFIGKNGTMKANIIIH